MYHKFFALDSIIYKKRKLQNEKTPKYFLKNFTYYLPKLEEDFYLNYFIRDLLFDIDILKIEDFLSTQFEHSENIEGLFRIVQRKVIPRIDKIVDNASFDVTGSMGYYNEKKLKDGFVETEGVIKNEKYDFNLFYHLTKVSSLKNELGERKKIVSEFLVNVKSANNNLENKILKWIGKPSHLAFIIGSLVEQGYIDPPLKKNKEINLTELSRQIQSSFIIDVGTTENTLRVYLNPETDKHFKLKQNFDKESFKIPNSGLLG